MLVVSRRKQSFHDDSFSNFSRYIHPGDCLVVNNTRVFPARLHGHRNGKLGAEVEIFLLRALNEKETLWNALVRPGKRVQTGDRIIFNDHFRAEVLSQGNYGERNLRLVAEEPVSQLLDQIGETPLPPYIDRIPGPEDRERYQTVFAEKRGSVAAPTAGLHFTPEILEACRDRGAVIAYVTLHVGLGTFAPVRAERVADVQLHEEYFEISAESAELMQNARRLFCVGTTTVRTLETAMLRGGLQSMRGDTNLFIYPGFEFRAAGAMLTNFHLPQSSLLILVSAFAGRELMLAAYHHAVAEKYRFFSYGDCMLIE